MTETVAADPVRGAAGIADIALAGLAGGGVDFGVGSLITIASGHSVERMWQGVAGGWLGTDTFRYGAFSFVLGTVTHFGIAMAMAAAYAIGAGRAPILYRRPWIAGAAYGLILYVVMNYAVIPARFGRIPEWKGVQSLIGVAVHVGVGLAIALVLTHRRPAVRPAS